ncbi:MAG: hypothetical protein JW731_10905 [Bacteroidales bacterium]|nr:hypothetical protein [Bacteroidales bacterium]
METANIPKPRRSYWKRLRKDRLALVFAILMIVPSIFIYRNLSAKFSTQLNPKAVGTVKVDRLRDLNNKHLKFAKSLGITPFKTNKEFLEQKEHLVSGDKLALISNSRYFVLEKLTHSHPYLVPEAAQLLDDIGKRFSAKLKENDKGQYYFIVSSLLRTAESQKSLSRSNGNASGNSTHLYGTTFDIPYSIVVKKPLPWIKKEVADAPVIALLSESIKELRQEGRCLVVTEYNERCFHITVMK